jgi:HSP20 family protein
MSEAKDTSNTANTTNASKTAGTPEEATLTPAVDVIEGVAGITLYADLPGVAKDKLQLHVESENLTIEGEIELPVPEGMDSTHAEIGLPRYRRVFTLSKELDAGKVSAEFDKGMLKLRIPKAEHAQARRIEVRVG